MLTINHVKYSTIIPFYYCRLVDTIKKHQIGYAVRQIMLKEKSSTNVVFYHSTIVDIELYI